MLTLPVFRARLIQHWAFTLQRRGSISPAPDLPWPVAWLLTCCSTKQRFCSHKPPPIEWLLQDTIQFSRKLQWRLHYQDSDRIKLRFYGKSDNTPSCPFNVIPDFKPWMIVFRRNLLSHQAGRQFDGGNLSPLHRLAMKELRKFPYVIAKDDKLLGYSFVPKSELVALEFLALPVSSYVPAYVNSVDIVDVKKTIVS